MEFNDAIRDKDLWISVGAAFWADRPAYFEENDIFARVRHDLDEGDDLLTRLERVFQARVLDCLPRPSVITNRELAEIAVSQLSGLPFPRGKASEDEGVEKGHFEMSIGKERFYAFTDAAFVEDCESSCSVFGDYGFDLGEWLNHEKQCDDLAGKHVLWKSNDFQLLVRPVSNLISFRLEGWLIGDCTYAAMREAAEELRPVIESIAQTICYSTLNDSEHFLSYVLEGEGREIFGLLLDAYLTDRRTTNDRLDSDILGCLATAVRVLVEADSYKADDVALSRCFTAIETLICPPGCDITDRIGRVLPAVMRRMGPGRAEKGGMLMSLYKLRCKNVHVGPQEVTPNTRRLVRRIAAGLIRSVVRWRTGRLTEHSKATQRQFIDDANSASIDGTALKYVGIDLSSLLPDSLSETYDPTSFIMDQI